MDADDLLKLSKKDPIARELFLWLKSQPLGIKTLGVGKAEEFTGIDYYDLVATFKDLEKIEAGNFVVGRKGHDSRMIWKYDTTSIGKVAIDGLDFLEAIAWNGFPKTPDDAITLLEPPKVEKKINAVKHVFNLRKDFQIELELPENVSKGELDRLKSWIDLLVY